MLTAVFLAAALVHAGLLAALLRRQLGLAEALVGLLLCGLLVDNLALAVSGAGLDAGYERILASLRYQMHALALPPLLVAAVCVAQRAGVGFLSGARAMQVAVVLSIAGIAWGFATEIYGMEFVPETLLGHTRLVSADGAPPLATILTNALLLIVAAAVWRRAKWPWLFAAALFIFAVNGATAAKEWSIVASNLAEVVFAVAWVATLRRFSPPEKFEQTHPSG